MTQYSFLTRSDVENYGSDLVDFAQRAAAHAMAPHLQNLSAENAELQRRLARESRLRLDQQVEAAIPNFREIDQDPRWHQWLLGIDPLNGRVRQQLLNDAIASGSFARVRAFFNGFLQQHQEHGATAEPTSHTNTGRRRPANYGKPTYTRAQIAQLYDQHRRGVYRGREAEWARQEADIIAASREGRVVNPMDVHGK
jgi:hypothetical protein